MRQELCGVTYFCRSTSTILAGSDGCSFDHAPFGSRARRLPKGGAGGCYASPREDVRRERLGRSRDRVRTGDAQELAGRRRLAALGCISSPPGTGAPRRSRLFRSFPYNVFPPGTPGDPSVAPKNGAALDAFPLLFSGARTRGPIIEFARVDRMRAFVAGAGPRIGIRHRHPRAASQSSSSAGVGLRPAFAFSAAIVSTNVSGKARLRAH